jgi:hypothetical protein
VEATKLLELLEDSAELEVVEAAELEDELVDESKLEVEEESSLELVELEELLEVELEVELEELESGKVVVVVLSGPNSPYSYNSVISSSVRLLFQIISSSIIPPNI